MIRLELAYCTISIVRRNHNSISSRASRLLDKPHGCRPSGRKGPERLRRTHMAHELPAVVRTDRLTRGDGRREQSKHRGTSRTCRSAFNPPERRVFRDPVHQRDPRLAPGSLLSRKPLHMLPAFRDHLARNRGGCAATRRGPDTTLRRGGTPLSLPFWRTVQDRRPVPARMPSQVQLRKSAIPKRIPDIHSHRSVGGSSSVWPPPFSGHWACRRLLADWRHHAPGKQVANACCVVFQRERGLLTSQSCQWLAGPSESEFNPVIRGFGIAFGGIYRYGFSGA